MQLDETNLLLDSRALIIWLYIFPTISLAQHITVILIIVLTMRFSAKTCFFLHFT